MSTTATRTGRDLLQRASRMLLRTEGLENTGLLWTAGLEVMPGRESSIRVLTQPLL